MTMNEKNDMQSPAPQPDQWSALLSDLGIEQPIETPTEAFPAGQDDMVTEPVVEKELESGMDSRNEMGEEGSAAPDAAQSSACDRAEETGKECGKSEKGNFFDKFPQIDFLGSSTREKVDLAVSGFTETILPAVRDTLQNTIDVLSSQRLGKAEIKDAIRPEPPKETKGSAKAPSRRSDPWSSLASQLGVLAGFPQDDIEEDEEKIVDSGEKASEPPSSHERTDSLANSEITESPASKTRQAEPRNGDSRRSRRGGRDRQKRESFWDNEKNMENSGIAEDAETGSDAFSAGKAPTDRQARDTDFSTLEPEPSKPTRSERDRRRGRRNRNAFFEDEPEQTPLFEEPLEEKKEEQKRGKEEEGDSDFPGERRGRRRRTAGRTLREEENAEVDRRAAAALRESGIDFESPQRNDAVSSGRRNGRNRASESFAEETDNGFAVDEADWVAEDETQPIERRRGRRSRSSRREESSRESERRDEAADNADMAQLHRGFPDWEEAVNTVVEVNIARRSQRQGGRGKR